MAPFEKTPAGAYAGTVEDRLGDLDRLSQIFHSTRATRDEATKKRLLEEADALAKEPGVDAVRIERARKLIATADQSEIAHQDREAA